MGKAEIFSTFLAGEWHRFSLLASFEFTGIHVCLSFAGLLRASFINMRVYGGIRRLPDTEGDFGTAQGARRNFFVLDDANYFSQSKSAIEKNK